MSSKAHTSPVPTDEQALIARLKDVSSREAAFSELVQRFQEKLYYHIRRMVGNHDDADDILQNTFIKAWKAMEGFRGDSKLHTWLYRIATNEALTALDRRKRRTFQDLEGLEDHDQLQIKQSGTMTSEDIEAKLNAAIETLPERQRAVFNLRYFDEMPYDEISKIMEVTTGSLKASYHHAVKKIEKQLKDEK